MRITLVGEGLNFPSGFGMQLTDLANYLAKAGHDVSVITEHPTLPGGDIHPKISVRPIALFKRLDLFDRELHKIAPDIVLCFWHLYALSFLSELRSAPMNCPVMFWFPWESNTLPHDAPDVFGKIPENRVIHLVEYQKELWKKHIKTEYVVPHSVPETFRPVTKQTQSELRRKWSERFKFPIFDDSLVILNLDRNTHHKRWDATFDYVRQLRDKVEDRKVILIAHTLPIDETENRDLSGKDLPHLAKVYDIEDNVCFTKFQWDKGLSRDELAELYTLCDFRISTSAGEGFGIPTAEAAACKCPQIVTGLPAFDDVLPRDTEFTVPPAFFEDHRECLWAVPDVRGMVDRTLLFLNDWDRCEHNIDEAYEHVVTTFKPETVCERIEEVLQTEAEKSPDWEFDCRWGYRAASWNDLNFTAVVKAIDVVAGMTARVLDIGAWTGDLIEKGLVYGLDIYGVELNEFAVFKASERAREVITINGYDGDWPDASVGVFTDQVDLIAAAGGAKLIQSTLDRLSYYDWCFIRWGATYKWGRTLTPQKPLASYLEQREMSRRHDLEEMIKEKVSPNFNHEIWQRGNDTSRMPLGLTKL